MTTDLSPGDGPPTDPPADRTGVVVLGGGTSSEHDVSLSSARDIAAALDPQRYAVLEFTQRRDGAWTGADGGEVPLAELVAVLAGVDVVIPALHGPGGEDGTVAALLDLVGVPYVGSGPAAGAAAMDKHLTKLLAASLGISVAPGVVVRSRDDAALADVALPVVVKPVSGGSSIGVSLVEHRSDLAAAVDLALRHGAVVMVEGLVEGREVDLGVVELADGTLRFGAPLEIVHGPEELFDTQMKYGAEQPFVVPADLDPAVADALVAHAGLLFRALGCRGLARVDFFVTPGAVVLNEVNTFPGFTAHSQLPQMFAAVGTSYRELVEGLVRVALTTR